MPRARTGSAHATERRGRSATPTVLDTAQRMVVQIEELAAEMAALRVDNETLRADLKDAMALMEKASAALEGGKVPAAGRGRGRGRKRATSIAVKAPTRARHGAAVRGRVTPEAVTPKVVMATIGKLGQATAAEIASEISRNGVPVSGRAIRFLAERAGARISVGEDGQRRYSVG